MVLNRYDFIITWPETMNKNREVDFGQLQQLKTSWTVWDSNKITLLYGYIRLHMQILYFWVRNTTFACHHILILILKHMNYDTDAVTILSGSQSYCDNILSQWYF